MSGQGRTFHAGFTLVEILATLSLLAIVLPTAMAGISISLETSGLAKQQAMASTLAYSKLSELVADGTWEQGVLSGDFSPDHPDYKWAAQVTDWDGTSLRQLDVKVTWPHRQQQRSVMLSTLVKVTAGEEAMP